MSEPSSTMSDAPAAMIEEHRLLSATETMQLKTRSPWMASWLVAHAWGTIFLAMAVFAWWPNPLTFVLAWMAIGARQLGLAVLEHDAAHRLLYSNQAINDWVAQWLCSRPIFSDMHRYRHVHLIHHRYTMQEEDPDLDLTKPFPIDKRSFGRKVWRDLSGQTAWKQRKAMFKNALGPQADSLPTRLTSLWQTQGQAIFANLVICAVVTTLFGIEIWLLLWVLPFMTYFALVTRLRSMGEHGMVSDPHDNFKNSRTTIASPIERAFLAPYYVNYHCEHHLFVFVPCYNLAKAHDLMVRKGLVDSMEVVKGYTSVFRMMMSKPAAA